MGHLGRLVQETADSMPIVGPDHRQTQRLHMPSNDIANLPIHRLWLAIVYCFLKGEIGVLDKEPRGVTDISHQVGFIEVSVVAIFEDTDVQVYYISILQRSCVRNPMANNLIYRSANTPRKIVIVEGRRVGILLNDELMNQSIYLLCGHSHSNCLVTQVQGLPPDLAGQTYLFYFFLSVYWDDSVRFALKPYIRFARLCIVWSLNMFGNTPVVLERVRERSERSSVLVSIPFFFLLVEQLMNIPERLEASLITEE
eukprot:CAMPEP_0170541098 /NCGR_PEP_ID=MMETSP0211-20121228/930_1 /TAXON_ID=311385 /ORGANISM="Pseudokeronopsis sp., Strain OXSARD2" /LENGTH=254 /DNA_ID=CAMNT_0010843711 /DNA_START=103 /DNA_END=867 /DNA_ORIENTATION=+